MRDYDDSFDRRFHITLRIGIVCGLVFLLAGAGSCTTLSRQEREIKAAYMTDCTKTHDPTVCAAGWKLCQTP